MVRRVARLWAGSVYAAMVPITDEVPTGAARFLEDLWRVAPWRVALPSTVGVIAIALCPIWMLGRPKLLHSLSPEDQDRLLKKLMNAKFYPVRLLFYAVKSQALVAVLRDDECRKRAGLSTA